MDTRIFLQLVQEFRAKKFKLKASSFHFVISYDMYMFHRIFQIKFQAYGQKQGPMHGLPISTPYLAKDYLQQKRFQAQSSGTTYVYDFPDMFRQMVDLHWKQYQERSSGILKIEIEMFLLFIGVFLSQHQEPGQADGDRRVNSGPGDGNEADRTKEGPWGKQCGDGGLEADAFYTRIYTGKGYYSNRQRYHAYDRSLRPQGR